MRGPNHDTILIKRIIYGFVGMLMVAAILLALLAYESACFWKEAREFASLKEDYVNHVRGFKRAIADSQMRDHEDPVGSKKKISSASDDEFVTVNRDPGALRASGFAFAAAHGLASAWKSLHSAPEAGDTVHRGRTTRRTRRKRVVQHREHAGSVEVAEGIPELAGTLAWPIDTSKFRITSTFGPRRKGRGGPWGFHYGLDMAASWGTPVRSVARGVIVEARRDPHSKKGWGNVVVVSHSDRLKTRYAHLSSIDVAVGDAVEQGQRIGRVGNTGHTRGWNGVHLHLEVLVYGKRVNPLLFYRGKSNA